MTASFTWSVVALVPCVLVGLLPITWTTLSPRYIIFVFSFLILLRSIIFMVVWHPSLSPDTFEYIHGQAWWSSAFSSLIGYSFGWWGLASESIVSVLVLFVLVDIRLLVYSRKIFLRMALLFSSPPSWFLAVASADSLGIAGFIFAYFYGPTTLVGSLLFVSFVCCCHLVCGLTLLIVYIQKRVQICTRFLSDSVVTFLCGSAACIGEGDVQVRYFLPFLFVFVVSSKVWRIDFSPSRILAKVSA